MTHINTTYIKCHLCGGYIHGCKAHILPRGLLKLVNDSSLLIVGTDIDRKRRAQTGSYDQGILCGDCDNKIGKYDDYCIKFISDSKLLDHPSGRGWTISGVDQKKLKLFCISYLWRASITSRPEFSGVSLGKVHEDKMRELIRTESTGSLSDYTVICSKFSSGKEGGILLPTKNRQKGIVYYEAYLPRLYKFLIKVDSRDDEIMSGASLESQEDIIFVHNLGDFESSQEKLIMIKAAKNSN